MRVLGFTAWMPVLTQVSLAMSFSARVLSIHLLHFVEIPSCVRFSRFSMLVAQLHRPKRAQERKEHIEILIRQ